MVDDVHGASPKNEPTHAEVSEDAETRAARRELKQSTISDPPASTDNSTATSTDGKTTRPDTPADNAFDAQEDELKEQVSSPKKKRAHDQLDGGQESEENDANSVASIDSTKDRALRLEPEKKRPRDEDSQGDAANSEQVSETGKSPTKKALQTSTSAFAASGFGKLATGSSPFAGLSGPQTSVFGTAGSSSLSPFGSVPTVPSSKPAAVSAVPKLTFGGTNSISPFAGLSTANGFGSGTGGSAFGSVLSGGKALPSFASSTKSKPLQSGKPSRPFGAPESDGEGGEDNEEGDDDAEPTEAERALSPDKDSDEKKKLKLHKVEVDDGESGEVTVVSVRAKMFHHDKEVGWKERGAGMLKINAPEACVEFDDVGIPIPGSFDASGLDLADGDDATTSRKVVRLIMRQDQTHRVILNTAILPAMKFQEKASLKSVGIVFTAFEGDDAKPVSITMKMSAANAKTFLNEIGIIQRELQGN
ncbi:Nuclear pore protein NUP56 [Cladobotryum mycophilum]|uniref:Nuclear pore protein NUP56 n=1 Tax=Cladobotryum mycophilum TaxID=491253 RepID=A0ABR0T235_9HYPO